jgi:small subunit ribosomal protein S18
MDNRSSNHPGGRTGSRPGPGGPRPGPGGSRPGSGSSRPGFGGPRSSSGPRTGGDRPGGRREFVRRRRVCKFCVEKIDYIDWKDFRTLMQFVPERGKIMPRRLSGVCAQHQRRLMEAVKKARNIALLPFASE